MTEIENQVAVTDKNCHHDSIINKRNVVCEKCNKPISPGETMVQGYKAGRTVFGSYYRRVINCCEACGLSKDDNRLRAVRCSFCGRLFYKIANGHSNKHVFCSDVCQYNFYNHQNSKDRSKGRENITCKVCKSVFSPQRSDAKYCSNACKQKYYRRKPINNDNE